MNATEHIRLIEAILSALIRRAGGKIRLSVPEIAAVGNSFQFCMKPDHQTREPGQKAPF